jgi:flagellar biosynthetic protein FliR
VTPPSFLDPLAPLQWPTLVLVTTRVLGMVLTAPLWSMIIVPARVRAALVIVVALLLLPAAPARPLPEGTLALPGLVGVELLLGIATGLVASLFMHGVAIAGDVMGVQTGLSIATTYDPTTEATATEIAQVASYFALALYVTLGGPLFLLQALGDSLRAIPPGSAVESVTGARSLVQQGGAVFGTAVSLAAPVMVTLFLTNVALAILTRAVPQISAFMVAFPITIGLGVFSLGASLPAVGGLVRRWAESVPGVAAAALAAFMPAGGGP